MTAPLRSKDIRGYALRINYRSDLLSLANGGKRTWRLRRRDFSFRIRATEHRLDSLHSTLNCLSRIAPAILDDDRGPRSGVFCERRAGKKVTNPPESLVGLHGKVRSCTSANIASIDISHLRTL